MKLHHKFPERTASVCSHLNYSEEEERSENENDNDNQNDYIDALWHVHKSIDRLLGDMSNTNLHQNYGSLTSLMDEEDDKLPPTYIVVTVDKNVPYQTLSWLVNKIRGSRRDGAAELIVMKQPCTTDEDYVLHVSATKIKFLEAAEEMEIMKEDSSGQIREFTVKQLDDFLPKGMGVEDLFTVADRQTIVRHELENVRALPEDDHVPGHADVRLYEGQSIFSVCRKHDIVKKIYPLHDHEHLKKLGQKWYISKKQPFDEIRLYFGEAIALYFTFLGYYTSSLVVPVAMGILQTLIPMESVLLFCAFNVVWVTVMLEVWRRKSNELAFRWGTIGMTSLDQPRANFRGTMAIDPITGKLTPQYPRYVTYVKMYCVSIPIVILCMIAAFFVMLCSFWIENWSKTFEEPYTSLVILPSIVYSVLVFVMNVYYRKLATFLTEWENHRTDSQFVRHKVTKLVLFEFVNNFMALFYIAFVIQDLNNLRSQLQTMLITTQFINNFTEALLPLLLQYWSKKFLLDSILSEMEQINIAQTVTSSRHRAERIIHRVISITKGNMEHITTLEKTARNMKSYGGKKVMTKKRKKVFVDSWKMKKLEYHPSSSGDFDDSLQTVPTLEDDDPRVLAADIEGEMDVYEETFDDYLELFIQFGYVFLFSSVYPMAALWALINNVIEIRADAFKLCQICQRPNSKRVKDIGAWQRSFEILGALSIVTNCGILYLTPGIRLMGSSFTDIQWLLLFVLLEHLLLGIRYVLHISIADKPEWVRVALAKQNHESKQALKHEREQRNKRLLTRKFKSATAAR